VPENFQKSSGTAQLMNREAVIIPLTQKAGTQKEDRHGPARVATWREKEIVRPEK